MEKFKLDGQIERLQGVCDENKLVWQFRRDTYPISMTIRPCNGVGEQMDMLANADENGYTSPNAFIRFSYEDGDIEYKTSETFSISDALFTKIKLIFKKMHLYYQQYFFRYVIENDLLSSVSFPEVKNAESFKQVQKDRENDGYHTDDDDDSDDDDDPDDDDADNDNGDVRGVCTESKGYDYEPVTVSPSESGAG